MPPEARWAQLRRNAQEDDIKIRLGDALEALERAYPDQLRGLLPRIYAGSNLARENVTGLINLFSKDMFKPERGGADLIGVVYEYFIGEFADSEGKRGGEYFTPQSIVKCLVAMLEPTQGVVYDPCCGSGGLKPLQSVYISEGYQEGTSSNAVNKLEARAVVDAILTCVNSPEYEGKTMGVISLLGKRQADTIGNMLIEELGAEEVEARNLVWGDAYSFQGDERNVMFLSLVSAPGERAVSALTSELAKQRFNVAASRAKDQMWLFRSAKLEHMSPNPNCVRRKLVEFFTQHNHAVLNEHGIDDLAQLEVEARRRGEQSVAPSPFDSWFEVDVFLDLHRRGYRVIPQFPVAQYRIDLIVESQKGRLAIECDGDFWHGPERYAQDMARQRQLERSGWEFYRIRGSHYYTDPQRALEPLWEELERREIYPSRSESFNTDTLPQSTHQKLRPNTNGQSPETVVATLSNGLSKTTLDALLDRTRSNPLIPVDTRVSVSETVGKLQDAKALSEAEALELTQLHETALSRGFEPPVSN